MHAPTASVDIQGVICVLFYLRLFFVCTVELHLSLCVFEFHHVVEHNRQKTCSTVDSLGEKQVPF